MAVGCVRRAWLTLGTSRLELEDLTAAYYCTQLDLGYPQVREVTDNRPDTDGVDDRTRLWGARAVSADIRAEDGTYTRDEIAGLFAPYMVPSARPQLHYVLDREGAPERFVTVRAADYAAPISGARAWTIHLAWVAADPVMRDPELHTATAHSGASAAGGRAYPLTFPRSYVAGGGAPSAGEVTTAGDTPVRPLLRLWGPITDPVVQLTVHTPGQPVGPTYEIRFVAGFRIDANRHVDVDTDRRTVTDDTGQSIAPQLDWAATTWPALPRVPAVTYLTLEGTTTTGVSQCQALWQDGYLT